MEKEFGIEKIKDKIKLRYPYLMVDRVREIKRRQKASQLYKTISELFLQAAQEDSRLQDIFVNRVELSADKSICWVLFYSAYGKEHFEKVLPVLELYEPSLRKSIAESIQGKYVPELRFQFDNQLEKQLRIEKILDSLNDDDTSS